MKNSISRQQIYLIVISLFLLFFVILFSFSVLIPEGKDYRLQRTDLMKVDRELRKYQNFEQDTMQKLKKLQHSNRSVITAFDATFNPQRFEKQNKKFFSHLKVSSVAFSTIQKDFAIYEVNTSSEINSPKSFYNFLDSINKSDWMITVNFPIEFKRVGKMINSSFTMKVYCNNRDTNASASTSEAK